MGSQQLLLIVVGIVVVALVIFAGINIAANYYQTANRDQLISSLYDLGVMAQQYFKKPVQQGGGGGSYSGWIMPKDFEYFEAGQIQVVVSESRVNFEALGAEKGMDEKTNVRVTCRVDQEGIRMIVTN
jgi:hypothetical protein